MQWHDVKEADGGVILGAVLRRATADLRRAGIEDAAADARRLAAAVLEVSGAQLLARPEQVLTPDQAGRLGRCIDRRIAREPVSRILGEREFFGRTFRITPATLDPRPDSETLVAAALDIVRREGRHTAPLCILDVGTGCGCLLLSLLAELPNAAGVGTDISEAALDAARQNADRLGLASRVGWLAADALDGVGRPFDVLVSNPPYVRSGDIGTLQPEVREFDPRTALDGGLDGLAVYRRLGEGIQSVIPDGWVILEVGYDQADAVAGLLSSPACGIDRAQIRFYRDVAGTRRCVAGRTRR